MKTNVKLGERIKKVRLSLGKTQEEFGAMFNPPAPKSAVSRWEHGGSPNKKRLKEIAKLGNVTVTYLLGTSDLLNSLGKIIGQEENNSAVRYHQLSALLLSSFPTDDKKYLTHLQNMVNSESDQQQFEFLVTELLIIFLRAKTGDDKALNKYNQVKDIVESYASRLNEFKIPIPGQN